MNTMKESELVLANDGSLYHIHLTHETLAVNVFLVGDPERVNMFKDLFDDVEYESMNRELHAVTGRYKGCRFTALSTGMGCDNIDIVLSELDAAANIDLQRRAPRVHHRTLNLVRIGTSGSLHHEIPCGSLLASAYAIGLDGLLNYYQHDATLTETELTERFVAHMQLAPCFATPYSVRADEALLHTVADGMTRGITVTAPGFYAPQGRHLRIAPAIADLNERLASFRWADLPITNLEMETSAIYGMARLMGHRALTVCLIIANRADGSFLNEYHAPMRHAVQTLMERMAAFDTLQHNSR